MKKFGLILLITAVLWAGLEGIARLYLMEQRKKITACPDTMEGFGDFQRFHNWENQLAKADLGLYYGTTDYSSTTGLWNKPNFSKRIQNVDLTFNSLGFRGPEFPLQKPKHVYRIFLVGASTVQGAVNEKWTISHYLQNDLDPTGKKIEVMNAGVVGILSENELDLIANKLLEMKPDLIITIDGSLELLNSNSPETRPSYKLQQLLDALVNKPRFSALAAYTVRCLVRRSAFLSLCLRSVQHRAGSSNEPAVTISDWAVQSYIGHLKNVEALLEANHVGGILIFQPVFGYGKASLSAYEKSIPDSSDQIPAVQRIWPKVGKKVTALPYSASVRVYDFGNVFRNETGSTYADPQHYSPLGDQRIAEALAPLIRKEMKLTP